MAELMMLRLEGVLQSWGESSAWDNRGTASFPTKSGIVGLLACAMGLERGDPEIARLSQVLCVGIRADRSGNMTSDFHTVQGMPRIINAAGKPRPGNTIVSTRWYLQDASFLIVLDLPAVWQRRIEDALADPVWSLYLGRKSCVPTRPVFDGIHREYQDISDAIFHYPPADRADAVMAFEVEVPCEFAASFSRADVTVGAREFEKRRVWRGSIRREQICI